MDPLLMTARGFYRKGIPSLTLLAGVLVGVFFMNQLSFLDPGGKGLPREVTPAAPLTSEELSTIKIFEDSAPSVVFISTKATRRDYFSRNVMEIERGQGTGFIWDENGHIVTNLHVLAGGNAWEVTLQDQTTYDAELVGYHEDKDLAVIRIDAPKSALKPLPLGTTRDLKVGQKVLAIGNPFGLDQTLTTGVVSALNRTMRSLNQRLIEGVVQTDAAINPGNSGGPLLDGSGRLIGVNTQIYSTSGASAGIGFAIPVDEVNRVVPQLITHGKVIRPVMGVGIDQNSDIHRQLKRKGIEGVLVLNVSPGGPADKAGIQPTRRARRGILLGDIITAVDGTQVKNADDLFRLLDRHKPGDQVKVTVLRQEGEKDLSVTLVAEDKL